MGGFGLGHAVSGFGHIASGFGHAAEAGASTFGRVVGAGAADVGRGGAKLAVAVVRVAPVLDVVESAVEAVASSEPADDPDVEQVTTVSPSRQLLDRTAVATAAARAGDCETVAKLDVQVRAIDTDFHDTVFIRDAAIAGCLKLQ